jgi:YjbE family integral membrane protein
MSDFLPLTDPGLLQLISQGSAFVQVVMIDLFMAGDNAVAVGLAAAGLAADDRKKAIMYGLIAAIVTRIIFVLLTVQLLQVPGLLLIGGVLLLWVAWKMYEDLRHPHHEPEAEATVTMVAGSELNGADSTQDAPALSAKKKKTLGTAIIQILIADVSMSLDNVLAVAGAAHHHVSILVFGLLLSIALMGLAAHAIADLLHKYRWIGYVGLAVILFVAGRMIWDGVADVQEHQEAILGWFSQAQTWAGLSGNKAAAVAN